MSYSEDRADSRSLTAVVLVLLGIAVAAMVLYFALWSPSRNDTDIIVTPTTQGPAGPAGVQGAQGTQGVQGTQGEQGQQGTTGTTGGTTGGSTTT
ncbi:MAG: hypothetical protein WD716_12905 [Fimbriimonadaceae bacterium]